MANGSKKTPTKSRSTTVPESKALVLAGNGAIVSLDDAGREYVNITFNAVPEGGEHDTGQMLRLSKMKLLNAQSKEIRSKEARIEGAAVGDFYDVSSGELRKELKIVPLMVFQERFFNLPKGSPNIVCMSMDGRAEYGICPSGKYEEHGIPTKIMRRTEGGPEMELGICSRCPHSQRAWGEQSECQHVKNLICFHESLLADYESYVKRLIAGDQQVAVELLNSLFFLPFQGTKMKALDTISQQANRSTAYFAWSWLIRSAETGNDFGEWLTYNPTRQRQLTADEMIFARSLLKFAQRVKPIITDFEDTGIKVESLDTDTTGLSE